MTGDLAGKKVLVTGGTRGIGFAIAKRFLEEGAEVAIFGQNKERGAVACEQLAKLGAVHFIATNVSVHSEVGRISFSHSLLISNLSTKF